MRERRRLGEILVEDYRVLPADIDSALAAQKYVPDRLGMLLVRTGVLSERDLVTALGQQLGSPVVLGLPRLTIGEEVIALVPMRTAERKLVIPVALSGKGSRTHLVLAMADPTDSATVDAIERITGFEVIPAIAPEEDLRRALKIFYSGVDAPRDMEEMSHSFELLRAHMHERTGTGKGAAVPMFDPVETGSTAA